MEQQLTSPSFRRGGAQHANSSAELAARWIFHRGAWNMSTTNKAFSYVFNTMSEDHKVAKVFSGWKPNEYVSLADLSLFDAQTQNSIREVQAILFLTLSEPQREEVQRQSARPRRAYRVPGLAFPAS